MELGAVPQGRRPGRRERRPGEGGVRRRSALAGVVPVLFGRWHVCGDAGDAVEGLRCERVLVAGEFGDCGAVRDDLELLD